MAAFTTPSTQVTGTEITSTMYKAHLVDNIKFLHGPPTVQVTRVASQTITASQWTAVAWSASGWDTNTMFATTGTKLTCKTAGKFLCIYNHTGQASTKGNWRAIGIRKNSTGTGGPTDAQWETAKPPSGFNWSGSVSALVSLTTGQFMEGVWWSDGSSNAVKSSSGSTNSPKMEMIWMSS